jgi:hypothetical protein
MTPVLPRNARKRESVIGAGPGGMESPSIAAGAAVSGFVEPDEVVAFVTEGVGA